MLEQSGIGIYLQLGTPKRVSSILKGNGSRRGPVGGRPLHQSQDHRTESQGRGADLTNSIQNAKQTPPQTHHHPPKPPTEATSSSPLLLLLLRSLLQLVCRPVRRCFRWTVVVSALRDFDLTCCVLLLISVEGDIRGKQSTRRRLVSLRWRAPLSQ